jgi:hypothetical protein
MDIFDFFCERHRCLKVISHFVVNVFSDNQHVTLYNFNFILGKYYRFQRVYLKYNVTHDNKLQTFILNK